MKSSLGRGFAAPKMVHSCFIRWGTISLLTASSLGTFTPISEAEESASHVPNPSVRTFAQTPSSLINRANLRVGSQGRDVSELQAALKLLGFYAGVVDGSYGQSTAIAVSQFQTAAGLPADGVVGPATWNQLFPPTSPSAILSSTRPATRPTSNSTPANSSSAATNSAAAFPIPQIANSGNSNPSRPAVFSATSSNNSNSDNNSGGAINVGDASEAASSVELPVLRLGMEGPAVSRLQERLQAAGFFQGVVDGDFGPETQVAVQAAQRQYQLEVDGIVGPATWKALLR